jgi:hypothetical protein
MSILLLFRGDVASRHHGRNVGRAMAAHDEYDDAIDGRVLLACD